MPRNTTHAKATKAPRKTTPATPAAAPTPSPKVEPVRGPAGLELFVRPPTGCAGL